MSAIEHAIPKTTAGSRLAAVARSVVALARRVTRAWVNRRHALQLAELSDHQLADIGQPRRDLALLTRSPFAGDPTTSLAEIARQRADLDERVRFRL
jgi:uncharacterized protein YjiS (DUF1127 family)